MISLDRNCHPRLSGIYKKRFRFTLACPSFIHPADYLPNVRTLGSSLDEIELLFLEGNSRQNLPDPKLIQDLAALGKSLDITYNVHLPTDISLTAEDFDTRRQAVETIARVLELVQPLEPTACVLHLPWKQDQGIGQRAWGIGKKAGRKDRGQESGGRARGAEVRGQRSVVRGQPQARRGLRPGGRSEVRKSEPEDGSKETRAREKEKFLDLGLQSLDWLQDKGVDRQQLVLENLESYPVNWVEEILEVTGLGLCLDLGHLLVQGEDPFQVFQRNRSRIRIMHLHGVDFESGLPRDHVGLHKLPSRLLPGIKQILESFQGVLCLEVFNFQDLAASLNVLDELHNA